MRLFKKKKKVVEQPDFSKYKIKINGKTMCAYESLTGRPFLKISDADDMKHLFYCSLVVNNEEFSTLEYEVFEYLMSDESVMKWLVGEYAKIGAFLKQFKNSVGDDEPAGEDDGKGGETKVFYMLEAITGLIVRMGMDPHYVMFDMEEWEITYYYRIMRDLDRERLTEERLWTYLQILPHVGKKIGGPEKLLPFPWESNRRQKELDNNTKAAMAFFKKQEEKNGESEQPDDNLGQGGVGGGEQLAVGDGEGGPNIDGIRCLEAGDKNNPNTGKVEPCDEE